MELMSFLKGRFTEEHWQESGQRAVAEILEHESRQDAKETGEGRRALFGVDDVPALRARPLPFAEPPDSRDR